MDPLGPVGLPGQRRVQRRAVVGLAAGPALDEADGLAVGDVDGGQEFEVAGLARALRDDHGDQP